MLNIAGKLRHKVDIYAREEYTDELGAKKFTYNKIKSVYASIAPIIGERVRVVKNDRIGGMNYTSTTIKFIMRIDAVRVAKDMYIMYRGQRYDVDYAIPIYKNMQYQEVYTQLKIENDNNLHEEFDFHREDL